MGANLEADLATAREEFKKSDARADGLARRLAEAQRIQGAMNVANNELQKRKKELEKRLKNEQEEAARLRQLVTDKADNLAETRIAIQELKHTLFKQNVELERLKLERAEQPLTNKELLSSLKFTRELLSTLQETLSCPMCLEPLSKGEVISLLCGHTFCEPCIQEWHRSSFEAKLQTPQSMFENGKMVVSECPECRDSIKGKVKIWAMEEAVRVLARYDPTALPKEPTTETDMSLDVPELDTTRRKPFPYHLHPSSEPPKLPEEPDTI